MFTDLVFATVRQPHWSKTMVCDHLVYVLCIVFCSNLNNALLGGLPSNRPHTTPSTTGAGREQDDGDWASQDKQ